MDIKTIKRTFPTLSETEVLEAYYITTGNKKLTEEEVLVKVYNSYKKAVYPLILAKEENEDAKLAADAYRELYPSIKAPRGYFLSHALETLYSSVDKAASCVDVNQYSEKQLYEIKAFIYSSLEGGENLSTVAQVPKEVLTRVFDFDISPQEFRSLCGRLRDSYETRLLSSCEEACLRVHSTFIDKCNSVRKDNSVIAERNENIKETACTVGKIGARGGIIIGMHTYGKVVLIAAGIIAAISAVATIATYFFVGKLISFLYAITLFCCGLFVWQAQVKSGENLKEFVLSFFIGLTSFSVASIATVGTLLGRLVLLITKGG